MLSRPLPQVYVPLSILVLAIAAAPGFAQVFTLVSPERSASVLVAEQEPKCVFLAVEDLASDVQKITGHRLQISGEIRESVANCVLIGTLGHPQVAKMLHSAGVDTQALQGKWESYVVRSCPGNVLCIAGSDARGTMFGVYDFIEQYLEVDPMYFWSGLEPLQRDVLSWNAVEIRQDEPSFKYRGWFINDEDLLTEWKDGGGTRNIDYRFYGQVVHRDIMRQIAESLVRLRYNLVIPASFVDIANPPEQALVDEVSRRGVFVSQHHIEPMGVSAYSFFNYWKARGKDYRFSYYSNPEQVEEVWRVYAAQWAKYPNVIWQIGLRGIADRPMWMADPDTPQSDHDRGRIISDAMARQMAILQEMYAGNAERPVVTTTLWAEGSVLNQKGALRIPDDVIVVFADNSPGWKWQADFYDTPRTPGSTYGVYYHHGLIGSGPHLAQIVPPHKTAEMLALAHHFRSDQYAIFNVGNVREFVLGVDATAKMTWNLDKFDANTFLDQWVRKRFDNSCQQIVNAYQTYFNSVEIHTEQGVPLCMDGQLRGAGLNCLSAITKKLKSPDAIKPEVVPSRLPGRPDVAALLGKRDAATRDTEAPSGDAFSAGLRHAHPSRYPRQDMIRALQRQRAGLQLALIHLAAAEDLPRQQADFLFHNLQYQARLLILMTQWTSEVLQADESLGAGDLGQCREHLANACAVFPPMQELAVRYCAGRWEGWYQGEKKIDLGAMRSKTKAVLDLANSRTLR